jgi:hypothetical protein
MAIEDACVLSEELRSEATCWRAMSVGPSPGVDWVQRQSTGLANP